MRRALGDEVLAAAARCLSEALGHRVSLVEIDNLRDAGSSRVARVGVEGAPDDTADTAIVKQAVAPTDAIEDVEAASRAFVREWEALRFVGSIEAVRAYFPRVLAADPAARCVVMEDLGEGPSLARWLRARDAARARGALLCWARALGEVHAETAGRRSDWIDPQRRSTGSAEGLYAELHLLDPDDLGRLDDVAVRLKIPIDAGLCGEFLQVDGALHDPAFQAFSAGDVCPDNNRLTEGSIRLFDLEKSSFRHCLLDAIYPRMAFPTCGIAEPVPPSLALEVEAAHREALCLGCPAARDEGRYRRAHATCCAAWGLWALAAVLPDLLDAAPAARGLRWRQARMLHQLRQLQSLGEVEGLYPALHRFAAALEEKLRGTWAVGSD